MSDLRRRDFISFIGGAAAAWPLPARAQQSAMPIVGFLRSATMEPAWHLLAAFRQGLKEAGFVEGHNVLVEVRAADGQLDRLPAMVDELLRRPVAVIIANALATQVAMKATTTVPIVFASGSDPIVDGLVPNFNRPGGNITGVIFYGSTLGAKRLELLRQIMPHIKTIGVLVTPEWSVTETERQHVIEAARAVGQQLIMFEVSRVSEIEPAFATLVERGAGAVFVGGGPFFNTYRERVVELAARHALPAIYPSREAVQAGGLISYGSSQPDAYRQAGIYVSRILKGEKPGDLPVIQSTRFELAINLKTARSLGIDVPPILLTLADEVIE